MFVLHTAKEYLFLVTWISEPCKKPGALLVSLWKWNGDGMHSVLPTVKPIIESYQHLFLMMNILQMIL